MDAPIAVVVGMPSPARSTTFYCIALICLTLTLTPSVAWAEKDRKKIAPSDLGSDPRVKMIDRHNGEPIPYTEALKVTSAGSLVIDLQPFRGQTKINEKIFILTEDHKGILATGVIDKINTKMTKGRLILDPPVDKNVSTQIFDKQLSIVKASDVLPVISQFNQGPIKMELLLKNSTHSKAHTKSTPAQMSSVKEISDLSQYMHTNPSLDVSFGLTTMESPSFNIVTGADLKPSVSYLETHVAVFLPSLENIPWLNWFGLILSQYKMQDVESRILRNGRDDVQLIRMTGKESDFGLAFRASFANSFVSRVGLRLYSSREISQSIRLDPYGLDEGGEFHLTHKDSAVAADVEFNPFSYSIMQVSYEAGLNGRQIIKDGITQTETSSAWRDSGGFIGAGLRYPFSDAHHRVVVHALGFLSWRQQAYANEDLLGGGGTKNVILQGSGFSLGGGYVY